MEYTDTEFAKMVNEILNEIGFNPDPVARVQFILNLRASLAR